LTEADEWRLVPGKLNPADAATRSQLDAEAIPFGWLEGSSFLLTQPSMWPKDLPWVTEKEEMRSVHVNLSDSQSTPAFNWNSVEITAQELPALIRFDGKYRDWVRRCQQEVYPEELKRLTNNQPIKSTSRLMALIPFLGEDQLLRLGGRLGERAFRSYFRTTCFTRLSSRGVIH
jgi:hypothetical protein